VNAYADDVPIRIPILEMDPQGYDKQVARLNQVRSERDQAAAQAALNAVREACQSEQNTMPALIQSAHAYCTLSEITDVMREVFGLYREPLHI
jgi:methylmalonyl-CoA mutase, N-terminal domain